MNTLRILVNALLPILLTIIGVMAMIHGEVDDSPGLMLKGLVIVIAASFVNIENFKSKSR